MHSPYPPKLTYIKQPGPTYMSFPFLLSPKNVDLILSPIEEPAIREDEAVS